MLKELILLKWQEKAANLASDDATSHVIELQDSISNLEGDLSNKRFSFLGFIFKDIYELSKNEDLFHLQRENSAKF